MTGQTCRVQVGSLPALEHYLHQYRLVPFLLRLWKSDLSLNFLFPTDCCFSPSGDAQNCWQSLLPRPTLYRMGGYVAATRQSMWQRTLYRVLNQGMPGCRFSCVLPLHFLGLFKVLIHVTCSSHLDHSTYLSDDQWHHPERYSCLFQKLCRGLPKLS